MRLPISTGVMMIALSVLAMTGCAQKPDQTGLRHGHIIPANYVTGTPRRIIMQEGIHRSYSPEIRITPFLRPLQPYPRSSAQPYGYFPELPTYHH